MFRRFDGQLSSPGECLAAVDWKYLPSPFTMVQSSRPAFSLCMAWGAGEPCSSKKISCTICNCLFSRWIWSRQHLLNDHLFLNQAILGMGRDIIASTLTLRHCERDCSLEAQCPCHVFKDFCAFQREMYSSHSTNTRLSVAPKCSKRNHGGQMMSPI